MTTRVRRWADGPTAAWVVAALALGLAAAVARDYAGGWNDGSRLATAESLVDRGTLVIDDSVFSRPQTWRFPDGVPPADPFVRQHYTGATRDKVFVGGHFYSHQPPLPAVLMAAAYRPLVAAGVPRPGEDPALFCRVMAVLTGGVGYAAAVGCLWALGRRVGLTPGWRLALVAGLAFGTVALPYAEFVNAHALQLGAVAGVCVLLARTADFARDGRTAWGSLVGIGTLAGVGVSLDFGGGPLLVGAVLVAVGWRFRRAGPVLAVGLAAAPWVGAAVGLNYAVGGGWKPLGMYPEYFTWPGSPFTPDNLTGFARRPAAEIAVYAADMLVGERGFLPFNLPLVTAVAGVVVLRRPLARRAELGCLLAWCGATWLLYAVLSDNMSGNCLSVRWFVPFLAPGFWLVAVVLRHSPAARLGYLALVVWGGTLVAEMVPIGAWGEVNPAVVGRTFDAAWLSWLAATAVVLAWRAYAQSPPPKRRGRPAGGGNADARP